MIDRPYVGTKPGLQIGCYFASEQYMAKNEDVVKRFRRGRGRDRGGDRARPGGVPGTFLPEAAEIPPPAAQKAELPIWKAESDKASMELTAELMESYGVTERSRRPRTRSWSDVASEDRRLLPRAAAALLRPAAADPDRQGRPTC